MRTSSMIASMAAVVVAGSAMASTVDINGGSSWAGWDYVSNGATAGVWAGDTTSRNFGLYQTYFTLDAAQARSGSPNAGDSASSVQSGSWQVGDRIIGVGLSYGGGQSARNIFMQINFGGSSMSAASSVGAGDGVYGQSAGDVAIQFSGTSSGYSYDHFRNFSYSRFNSTSGSDYTVLSSNYDNSFANPIRSFAVATGSSLEDALSIQMFYNIDAAVRANQGTGTFVGGTTKIGIAEYNGSWAGSKQVFAAVPAPGAVALLGAAGFMGRRRRN